MADGNPQPGDKARHPGGVQQPQVHRLVTEHRSQEAQRRDNGGRVQGVARHAATRQLREDARRFAVAGQGIQHTRRGVHPRVTRRQNGRQDNGVHDRRRRQQTGVLEDQRERADGDIFNVVAQQARIGIWNDQADNQDREDVKQQDTPEDLAHRARNVLLRVLRLTGGNTDKLGALEGEADNHRHADHRREAAGKRRIRDPPVAPAGRLRPFEDADNHHHADDDKDNDGGHFDQREPVFRLAKAAHRDPVQQEHNAEEQGAPNPARGVREPVAHHQLRGHQINGDRYRPVVPVVPAQREAKALFNIILPVGGEGTGHRHKRRQFAQAGHQEIDHQTDQNIRQQRPAGTCLRNRCARGNKKTRTDGTADGDHGQVARLQFTT